MAKEVVAANENAVTGLAGLASGLRRTKSALPSFGGKKFLKFGKDGEWSFGRNSDALNEGVAVLNITSLKSGYVCWSNHDASEKKKNEKLGEEMILATMGAVDPSTLTDLGWEWKQQHIIEGRMTDGDKEEFQYTTSSVGGLEAMDGILDAVLARISEGETVYLFPLVKLLDDNYDHSQWGKTYKPVLDIVDWADVEGVTANADAALTDDSGDDDEAEEAPKKKGKNKKAKIEEPAEDEDDDGVDEETPPVRRRRRR